MKPDINVQNNSVAIVGWHDGAAGQIHSWLEKSRDYHIACFVNPTDKLLDIDASKIQRDARQFSYPTDNTFKDKPLINSADWVTVLAKLNIKNILVTTDDPHQRFEQINLARKKGFKLINAIHPTALIMEDVILHDNIILYPRAYVGYRVELFPGVIVNGSSHLDHHNVIRECATIDPGVVCAGNVTVGAFSRVHTGATIINRIRIGKNSILGAGTVIVQDVPDNVTVVGVPGKVIKHHNGEELADLKYCKRP